MARNEDGRKSDRDQEWEVERYRQAAEDALQQLDWCIGYLHGIRKVDVSRALAGTAPTSAPSCSGGRNY